MESGLGAFGGAFLGEGPDGAGGDGAAAGGGGAAAAAAGGAAAEGDAPPRPRCPCTYVAVGGGEDGAAPRHLVVSEWGAYEADRREEAFRASGGGEAPGPRYYPGRRFIGGADAARSLLGAGVAGGGFRRAGDELVRALDAQEARVLGGGSGTLPALAPVDVEDGLAGFADPAALLAFSETLAAATGVPAVDPESEVLAVPPLPRREVSARDPEAVLRLQRDAVPFVEALEFWLVAVARQMVAAAARLRAEAAGPGR